MPRTSNRLVLLTLGFLLSIPAFAGAGALQCPPVASAVNACCDPLLEPDLAGTQACRGGHACCADGDWRCDNSLGETTCDSVGTVGTRCCDSLEEPGQFDNLPCFEGATCCATGQWQCNESTGISSCTTDGERCAVRCCDPLAEPGAGENPPCFEGATCCGDGNWSCNDEAGASTCDIEGPTCERCCDSFSEPGRYGNPFCFEGASCCSTGEWECNDATGTPICNIDGQVCDQLCCDLLAEPGRFGNFVCFEGATCCDTGEWQCNDGSGTSTCVHDARACERCCDALAEPGEFGNPPCFEGATCCGDGTWSCNEANGGPTCTTASVGSVCPPPCCDAADRPDADGTAACVAGFTCCGDGTWRCNDADGLSTCPGEPGFECPRRCGGIAGVECLDGEFCKLPVGECCCDTVGICVDKPQACPDIFDPVCGCDGTTYGNKCEADAAGVSIEHAGECPKVCGGFAGGECAADEFCLLADGECCCDFEGVCVPLPHACPLVCDLVCGCDGETYFNRCEAAQAGASVEHIGACFEGGDLVSGVRFDSVERMRWDDKPEALVYNLYGRPLDARPPQDYGRCLHHGIQFTGLPLTMVPEPGVLWILQVTAVFGHGEGSMGFGQGCRERMPAAPCTCTLPPDVGPCDAAIPRWYHDVRSQQCTEFIWGGCGGNANNFETLEDCEAKCAN